MAYISPLSGPDNRGELGIVDQILDRVRNKEVRDQVKVLTPDDFAKNPGLLNEIMDADSRITAIESAETNGEYPLFSRPDHDGKKMPILGEIGRAHV